jgi:hypothetical protein
VVGGRWYVVGGKDGLGACFECRVSGRWYVVGGEDILEFRIPNFKLKSP